MSDYPHLKALGVWIAKTAILGLVLGLIVGLWGSYQWHRGFGSGADAALCLIGHQVDGPEAAMRSRACQNIKGKKPPYFPGKPPPGTITQDTGEA